MDMARRSGDGKDAVGGSKLKSPDRNPGPHRASSNLVVFRMTTMPASYTARGAACSCIHPPFAVECGADALILMWGR